MVTSTTPSVLIGPRLTERAAIGLPWIRMRATVLKVLAAVGALLALAALLALGRMWWDSRLPSTYNVMDFGSHDFGGGAVPAGHHSGGVSVDGLKGPQGGAPDARFTLTAKQGTMRLPSGRTIDALTFDGRSPGPELRVRQGDLVEVTLRNEDVAQGVTIHWHGADVPNAEDGVAVVTQDDVPPGERFVYRFRAEQVGTFWYHSHQVSSKEVRRGLFGAFVIEPPGQPRHRAVDLTLVAHDFSGRPTVGTNDMWRRRIVAPGTPVRLRLVNSNSFGE